MRLPNKIISYNESTLSKLTIVLKTLKNKEEMSPLELYKSTGKEFSDLAEYIDALDCLYTLNAIRFNDNKGVIYYAL